MSILDDRPPTGPPASRWHPRAPRASRRVAMELGNRRVLHEGRWLWLRSIAWLVVLFFLTAAAFGLPLQAGVDRLPPERADLQLGVTLAASACALLLYALAVRFGEGRQPTELGPRSALRGLTTGAATGLALMATLMAVMVATGLYAITWVGLVPAWGGLSLAVQAAVTEELWMRALLFRLLWRTCGPLPAFALSALVFGALHLANPGATIVAGATVTLAGLMFCALYALTGRLWVPIGLHLAWNFAQGSLFGAVVSGGHLGDSVAHSTAREGAEPWLTGGTFGPEGSVLALLLISLVTAGALVLASREGRFARSTSTRGDDLERPHDKLLHGACDDEAGTSVTGRATGGG